MSVSQAMTLQMPRGDVRPAHPALVTSLFPARDFCPAIKVFVHPRWEDGWEAQPSKLTELKPTLKPWQWAHREPAEGGHPLPAAPHIRNARSYPTWRGEAVVPSVLCATCCGSCVFFFVFSGYWRSRAKHLGRIATDVTLHDILGDVSLLISSGSLFSFSEQFDFLWSTLLNNVLALSYERKMTSVVDALLNPNKQTILGMLLLCPAKWIWFLVTVFAVSFPVSCVLSMIAIGVSDRNWNRPRPPSAPNIFVPRQ